MRLKLNFVWLTLALLFLAGTGHAQTVWTECQGCNQWSAKTIAEQGWAPATRVIFDAAQNVAWKFDVQREQVGQNCQINGAENPADDTSPSRTNDRVSSSTVNAAGSCQWQNVACQTSMDSADAKIMLLLRDAYVETGGTFKASIPINRDDIFVPHCGHCVQTSGSGYDVVNDMMYRNQLRTSVNEYMRSLQAPIVRLRNLVEQAFEIVLLGGDMTVTFIVTFPDGTIVPVVFDAQNSMGFIDPDRVTDENGNPIMSQANRDSFAHFGAVYRTSDAAENFLRNAERLGVPVTRARYEERRTVSCTWKCENTSAGVSCHLECSSQ